MVCVHTMLPPGLGRCAQSVHAPSQPVWLVQPRAVLPAAEPIGRPFRLFPASLGPQHRFSGRRRGESRDHAFPAPLRHCGVGALADQLPLLLHHYLHTSMVEKKSVASANQCKCRASQQGRGDLVSLTVVTWAVTEEESTTCRFASERPRRAAGGRPVGPGDSIVGA